MHAASKSASYSKVIEQFAPLWALVVPLFNEGKYSGSIIVTYDLDKLLNQEIPWWFVQRYNLNLRRQNNKQLSPSDAGLVEHQGQINRLDFGGGHTGLSLNTSVREKTFTDRLLPSLTIAVIVFDHDHVVTTITTTLGYKSVVGAAALRERDELCSTPRVYQVLRSLLQALLTNSTNLWQRYRKLFQLSKLDAITVTTN